MLAPLLVLAIVATVTVASIATLSGRRRDEALCQEISQSPSTANITLACADDGFRIYSPGGYVSFGNRFGNPWIGSSQLLVRSVSSSPSETDTAKADLYLVNLADGPIGKAPIPDWVWEAVPRSDGKRIVRIENNNDKSLRVELVNLETDGVDVIYDSDPSIGQWAKEDAHQRDAEGSLWTSIRISWITDKLFVLTIEPFNSGDLPRSSFRPMVTLVNIDEHSVHVLSRRGEIFAESEGDPLVWQDGWIDGALYMLAPPYNGQPVQLAPAGLWKTDVALAGNGQRIAWIESTAPPGNWTTVLPITCINCVGAGRPADPLPHLQSLAVWDGTTGQVRNLDPPSGLIWYFTSTNLAGSISLQWRKDAQTLLYAAQITEDNTKRTALYQVDVDSGKTDLLAKHDWYGNLHTEWVGDDGSVYYYLTSRISEETASEDGPGKVWHLHSDGTLDTLHETELTADWRVDSHGLLEALDRNDRGVVVRDLNTGVVRHARFPQASPGEFGLGFNTIADLIPLSPDGKWAAFAGSLSDVLDENTSRNDILIAAVK